MKTSCLAPLALCRTHVKQMLTDAALFSLADDRRRRVAVGRRTLLPEQTNNSQLCVCLNSSPALFIYLF